MVNWRTILMGTQSNKDKLPHGGRLPAESLRRTVDPTSLGFRTTDDLEPITGLIGQERALRAIEFGVNIRQEDFNLFVLGPPEAGKRTAVRSLLSQKAKTEATPPDWVYVNNFQDPDKPRAIKLPTGRANRFAELMVEAIDELKTALPARFESEEYQARRRAIEEEIRGGQEREFEALSEKARAQSIAVLRTPTGFAMAPTHEGKVIKPEVFETLPEVVRKEIEAKIEALQQELASILEKIPRMQKEHRTRLQSLNEEIASIAVGQAIGDVEAEFKDIEPVMQHLAAVRQDLIRNVGIFLSEGNEENGIVGQSVDTQRDARFRRYMVNVIVHNDDDGAGAPIIEELNPTYPNLMGRVEHIARMGALLTDFLLIKPGALHKANGGYLMLSARKLLTSPFAWEALKRALKSHELRIETPAEFVGVLQTQTLEPDPIPLKVKVVLFGEPELFYLLTAYEPDFARLFKVQADFDASIDRNDGHSMEYARVLASIVRSHKLRPIDRTGVARLIEEGSRLADDNRKLSIEIGKLVDIVSEADYWAGKAGRAIVGAEDVRRAIEEAQQRADRVRDKMQEQIQRDMVLVDTSGAKVGQINGLSVLSLGNFSFGKPSRITARVRMGAGRVTDIEREVELGGPLHSKGVMILWGFLAGRYAEDVPLALSASLVFEQSYGGVDGDSASSAELYALLSALSEVPIKQSYAVTGSVNQHGEIQVIGGVNEKIEGFFDICKARGLTGEHGVLIPLGNVQHLMLREDVVEAAREGKFHIHAVSSVDEGIEILTGRPAGARDSKGNFPKDSINGLVEERLQTFAAKQKAFGRPAEGAGTGNSGKVS
jgi:predicted ATP-dependent protease